MNRLYPGEPYLMRSLPSMKWNSIFDDIKLKEAARRRWHPRHRHLQSAAWRAIKVACGSNFLSVLSLTLHSAPLFLCILASYRDKCCGWGGASSSASSITSIYCHVKTTELTGTFILHREERGRQRNRKEAILLTLSPIGKGGERIASVLTYYAE